MIWICKLCQELSFYSHVCSVSHGVMYAASTICQTPRLLLHLEQLLHGKKTLRLLYCLCWPLLCWSLLYIGHLYCFKDSLINSETPGSLPECQHFIDWVSAFKFITASAMFHKGMVIHKQMFMIWGWSTPCFKKICLMIMEMVLSLLLQTTRHLHEEVEQDDHV